MVRKVLAIGLKIKKTVHLYERFSLNAIVNPNEYLRLYIDSHQRLDLLFLIVTKSEVGPLGANYSSD